MSDMADAPFLGERINIKTDLGTVTTMVPYLQATASNTLTPLLMGNIPSGAKYIDVRLQGGYVPWSSTGGGINVITYSHIELVNGKVIEIGDSPSSGAIQCFDSSSNKTVICDYLGIVMENGNLYFANGNSTDATVDKSRWLKGSLYHSGIPERVYISVTFYDK